MVPNPKSTYASPHPLLVAWRETTARIHSEAEQLLYDRKLMNDVREMVIAEPRLSGSGHPFLHRLRAWYTNSTIMTIRRQSDRPDQDSHSLRSMLDEMTANSTLLTRGRLIALYQSERRTAEALLRHPNFLDSFADWKFVRAGAAADDYIDPAVFQADVRRLIAVSHTVRRYANKHLAHLAKRGAEGSAALTFAEIDAAIDAFEEVAIRYIALLTGYCYTELTATDQFDSRSIFRFAWAPTHS